MIFKMGFKKSPQVLSILGVGVGIIALACSSAAATTPPLTPTQAPLTSTTEPATTTPAPTSPASSEQSTPTSQPTATPQPPTPPSTPVPATATPLPSTPTATPVPPTSTPTPTPRPEAPTATPVPTATATPSPTANHLPTADFTFQPKGVARGDNNQTVITFTATASDPDGDPLTFEWRFSSGTPSTATGQVATTTFPGLAPYAVTLTVSDGRGGTVTVRKTVPVT